MLMLLSEASGRLEPAGPDAGLADAVWIDLEDATADELARVQQATSLRVPSLADLSEIETSSRLAAREGVLYLSMPLTPRRGDGRPVTAPLGFVLSPRRLITIRFAELPTVECYEAKIATPPAEGASAVILVGLLEAMVDRLADVLEHLRDELDETSHRIFDPKGGASGASARASAELGRTLQTLGRTGDAVSRIRDSLLAVGRLVPFVTTMAADWLPAELSPRLKTLREDIASLADYQLHLSSKVQFLLDATLGLINIAQNEIVRILTVVSVIGVPPVLIAGIYGMNFQNMPELHWHYGYAYGLILIVVSAILPVAWFKRAGWI